MHLDEIHGLVRFHYAELRQIVDDLDLLVQQLIEGNTRRLAALLAQTNFLHERLYAHTDLEDQLLAPYLEASRSRNAARELLRHHQEQRRRLACALVSARDHHFDVAAFARSMRALIGVLREKITQEERDLLCPRFLAAERVPATVPVTKTV